MNLIEKKNGALAAVAKPLAGGLEDRAHFFHPDCGGVHLLEVAFGVRGDELREGRLSGAGRAIEDHAGEPVGFEHSPQQLAGAEEVLLADKFIQRSRPHADSKRRARDRGSSVAMRKKGPFITIPTQSPVGIPPGVASC